MNTIKQKNQSGAALLLYLLIMIFVIAILMTATYSRLLLSLKRGQSTTDTLVANYQAESEVYDLLARLSAGYLRSPININDVIKVGDTKITRVVTENGNTQTVSVTADRAFASSKIVAERTVVTTGQSQSGEILLGLDCTGSMNEIDSGDTATRIANLKAAALNFVDNVPNNGKFKLGVFIFGIDAKWLQTNDGRDITLGDKSISIADIHDAINTQFGSDWASSSACKRILNATSIGSAFTFAQDYFVAHPVQKTKQMEIVITDGEPNARIPYPACPVSFFCPGANGPTSCAHNDYGWKCPDPMPVQADCIQPGTDFMKCSIADTSTILHSGSFGVRPPDVTAYAVTISVSPSGPAAEALSKYLGDNYFPASRAGDLTKILSNILTDIETKQEQITVHKALPG